jgi:hypothetical protein
MIGEMKELFTVLCIITGLTFALHHAERRTERERVRAVAAEEKASQEAKAKWESDGIALEAARIKAEKEVEGKAADQRWLAAREQAEAEAERTDFSMPASGYATYEDAALWAVITSGQAFDMLHQRRADGDAHHTPCLARPQLNLLGSQIHIRP